MHRGSCVGEDAGQDRREKCGKDIIIFYSIFLNSLK